MLITQLSTQLEQVDYAFAAVAGTASMLGILVFIWGARILRKVRRVALSGRAPPSLRILAIPMRHGSGTGVPIIPSNRKAFNRIPRVTPSKATGLWARLFAFGRGRGSRRFESIETSDPHDPIWINEKADQARARDAFMAGWTGKSANAKDWEEMREAGTTHSRMRWNKD
jgi:magnesium transporter